MSRTNISLLLGLLLGALATGVVALIAIVVWLRDPTPPLTRTDFDAAEQRWKAKGPHNYDLDVVIAGRQPGRVHVEVRDGEITRMTRDGVEPRQQRTWYYWSVPGQLETIGWELEKAADPVAGFQAPAGSRVVQRAVFDAQYGYPKIYRRAVLGTDMEVGWETVSFRAR